MLSLLDEKITISKRIKESSFFDVLNSNFFISIYAVNIKSFVTFMVKKRAFVKE